MEQFNRFWLREEIRRSRNRNDRCTRDQAFDLFNRLVKVFDTHFFCSKIKVDIQNIVLIRIFKIEEFVFTSDLCHILDEACIECGDDEISDIAFCLDKVENLI